MSLDYSSFKIALLAAALPPTPFILLAAWSGWRLKRGRRWAGRGVALALLGLWFSATEVVGKLLIQSMGPPPALSSQQIDGLRGKPDGAVLVLGAGVRRLAPEMGIGVPTELTSERLNYGVWLARRTGWPLGFSGGIGWTATKLTQPESAIVARVAALDFHMPLRWAEGRSRDTRENAQLTLPLLADSGVKRVVLVTHDAHMPRALRAFAPEAQRLGIEILPAPVGLREDGFTAFSDWTPTVGGFARVRYAVYEMLARWSGR